MQPFSPTPSFLFLSSVLLASLPFSSFLSFFYKIKGKELIGDGQQKKAGVLQGDFMHLAGVQDPSPGALQNPSVWVWIKLCYRLDLDRL